jgi:hypothetical protein
VGAEDFCVSSGDVFIAPYTGTYYAYVNNQCHLDKVFYDENSISYAVMH